MKNAFNLAVKGFIKETTRSNDEAKFFIDEKSGKVFLYYTLVREDFSLGVDIAIAESVSVELGKEYYVKGELKNYKMKMYILAQKLIPVAKDDNIDVNTVWSDSDIVTKKDPGIEEAEPYYLSKVAANKVITSGSERTRKKANYCLSQIDKQFQYKRLDRVLFCGAKLIVFGDTLEIYMDSKTSFYNITDKMNGTSSDETEDENFEECAV